MLVVARWLLVVCCWLYAFWSGVFVVCFALRAVVRRLAFAAVRCLLSVLLFVVRRLSLVVVERCCLLLFVVGGCCFLVGVC